MQYTLKPDSQGNITVDNKAGTFKPGDTLCITGNPKSVLFSNLIGAADARITITNDPNQKLVVGNPAWNGGGYSYAMVFKRCKHINLVSSSKGMFNISGSTTTTVDRGAYFNVRFEDLCDNITVRGLSIQDGGNAIWCKTEVSKTDSNTWYPNVQENFIFEDLDIKNTYTEGLYIGHTGTWWDLNTWGPYYDGTPTDLNRYKQPVKLKNVIIRNCKLDGCGLDGIQTAAIDGLQVYNNEVKNWGTRKDTGHCGGILIGGRVKGFNVHDNYVHDGWGNLMQIFAEGGAESIVKNNLLVTTSYGEGVMMRGTSDLIVKFTNNTVLNTPSSVVRINGYYGQKSPQIIQDNILAGTQAKNWLETRDFIYEENEGKFIDSNNVKLRTVEEAQLDANYQPLPVSKASGIGYKKVVPEQPKPDEPTTPTNPTTPSKVYITGVELLEMIKGSSLEIAVDPATKKITLTVQ